MTRPRRPSFHPCGSTISSFRNILHLRISHFKQWRSSEWLLDWNLVLTRATISEKITWADTQTDTSTKTVGFIYKTQAKLNMLPGYRLCEPPPFPKFSQRPRSTFPGFRHGDVVSAPTKTSGWPGRSWACCLSARISQGHPCKACEGYPLCNLYWPVPFLPCYQSVNLAPCARVRRHMLRVLGYNRHAWASHNGDRACQWIQAVLVFVLKLLLLRNYLDKMKSKKNQALICHARPNIHKTSTFASVNYSCF